jgi:hypothetical protein
MKPIFRVLGAGVAMFLGTAPLYAQEPAPAADVTQLIELFDSFCIAKFPDDAGLKGLAQTRGGIALTPEQVKAYLHGDPGYGWVVKLGSIPYVITIELPPYQACAVRRMTPSGAASVKGYVDAVNRYIAANNRTLVGIPAQKSQVQGIDITAYPYGVKDAAGKPTDQFAVFLTNYHHHPPVGTEAEAAGGVGVEVRMVHQIVH